VIGDNKSPGMKEFKVIQLQNRSVEKILDFVPADIKSDVDLKEFPELNSVLASGLPDRIRAVEMFMRSIDKVVPVILIEIMIVDLKKTNGLSTGISAGLGDKPSVTKGTLYPGVDMSFSAQSVNNLINSFNGFGSVTLGKVTPNFYLSLKALETDNIIDLRSTPKLSALNGHDASLTIGSTKYYREQQSNVYGSLTAQTNTIENFKSNDANLTVKIKPSVSGNDQITLDIDVQQEDFTDQIKEFAPFNKIKREFKSLIRVRNQEMILLGGLEEKSDREDGSGVPFLSRIPIIKWLFSNKTKTKVKSKLNIFIKPTIIE
jgi:Type II secretory pathway, component PulD